VADQPDREIGEGLIARALQIVVDANGADDEPARDYTADELEELIYCLTMGAVKLKKLPGGEAAAERVYARAKAEQARRQSLQVVTP